MERKGLNAQEVLEQVEKYIAEGGTYSIRLVYRELSIFDWWPDWLTQTHLKDMRKFLKEAIKLGYTGYVCFKVGATGCANGMWAHIDDSTNGYAPDGEFLYKSFTPDYNYWSWKDADGDMNPPREFFDRIRTIKELEKYHNRHPKKD